METIQEKVTNVVKKVSIKRTQSSPIEENYMDVSPRARYREKILENITHPNKQVLAEKLLSGVPLDELYDEYGNTRVLEMNTYIDSFISNFEKQQELKAKRGQYGTCVACQS